MISVAEALDRVFALVAPLDAECIPLALAADRVLARPVAARHDQPPFRASVMDGYAMRAEDVRPGARLEVIGEAAAGHVYSGPIAPGQAIRIFTGAPVPEEACRVVIQEDVRRDGTAIILNQDLDEGPYIRRAGADFAAGARMTAPRRLTPSDIALLAAMNIAEVPVSRCPAVALIATGDELVMPGETPGPGQIIASNGFGLKAMLQAAGAEARLLPIARDTEASLTAALELAHGADLIVTIGGASVGDHDLVAQLGRTRGLDRAFYKVAMRPGKPLMAGRLEATPMIGLPGNPVSAMVCGAVFLVPAVRAMLGLPAGPAPRRTARLADPLAANGPREHYMRAALDGDSVTVFGRQDSALLSVLSAADALVVRPPKDPARAAGEVVEVVTL